MINVKKLWHFYLNVNPRKIKSCSVTCKAHNGWRTKALNCLETSPALRGVNADSLRNIRQEFILAVDVNGAHPACNR